MEGFMDSRDHPIKKFVTGQKGKVYSTGYCQGNALVINTVQVVIMIYGGGGPPVVASVTSCLDSKLIVGPTPN
ncbi:unnamed protein product [Prunus armeniaca]|uniref:Uncharacterized protein n=1 Tax=Prunus armeniaca TaxID=36596 RepID=A0A6J5XU01_PRUAR|nr:unnamed protein product [Prunus armeniaca]